MASSFPTALVDFLWHASKPISSLPPALAAAHDNRTVGNFGFLADESSLDADILMNSGYKRLIRLSVQWGCKAGLEGRWLEWWWRAYGCE